MKQALILLSGALALAGCSSKISEDDFEKYPVQTETIEAVPHIPQARTAGTVRAYRVGRTVDPADLRVMHEAHWVYRVEEDPSFILYTEDKVVLEPSTHPDPNYAPVLLEQELAAEVMRQRQISAALKEAIAETQQQSQRLIEQTAELAEATAEVMAEQAKQRNQPAAQGAQPQPQSTEEAIEQMVTTNPAPAQ
jgi:hypothetical protein